MKKLDPKPLKQGRYKTDVFNRESLYIVLAKSKSRKSLLFKNSNEAFNLIKKNSAENINPGFLASMIQRIPTSIHAPFKGIKRVPRSYDVTVDLYGDIYLNSYKPFKGKVPKYSDSELHNYIRKKIAKNILQVINPVGKSLIGVEHSSGLDSNVIMGNLRKNFNLNPSEIFTYTDMNSEDKNLLKTFRDFYKLDPKNCFSNCKILNKNDHSIVNKSFEKEAIKILGAPSQGYSFMNSINILSSYDCKLIFSGLGGDQGLSHNGLNIIYELIKENKYQSLYKWARNPFAFMKIIYKHFFPEFSFENYFFGTKNLRQKAINSILINNLKPNYFEILQPYFSHRKRWETNLNISLKESIINRITNDWISVRMEEENKFAKHKNSEMIYPFIDEQLINVLINQDPIYFSPSQDNQRLLSRISFKDILPTFLKENYSKYRLTESKSKNSKDEFVFRIDNLIEEIKTYENEIINFFNLNSILNYVSSELHKNNNLIYLREIEFSLSTLYKLCIWGDELSL